MCAIYESDFGGATQNDLALVGTGTEEAFNMLRDRGHNAAYMCFKYHDMDSTSTEVKYMVSQDNHDLKKEIEKMVDVETANLDRESAIEELVEEGRILKINENYFPRGSNYKWDPQDRNQKTPLPPSLVFGRDLSLMEMTPKSQDLPCFQPYLRPLPLSGGSFTGDTPLVSLKNLL